MNAQVEIVDDVHAPFSPSGFKRKKLCAASHLQEQKYPNKSSEAAIDGTHTHTLVEACLIHKKTNANIYIGEKLIDHEGEFTVDKDRAARANMALQYVDNQVTASAYPVLVTPEQSVNPGSLIFRDDWFGTADITMIFAEGWEEGMLITPANIKWINVADYKDGAMPVDPVDNYQGVSYALGVIAQFNPLPETPIIFTIIQPKAGGIKEWHTTVGELLVTWLPRCQDIINRCLDSNAPFCAGEEQCHYCLHRKECDARQGKAVDGINNAMGNINLGGTLAVTEHPIRTTLPSISKMENETLSQVMLLAPIIRGWLKDIDEEALERVKTGGVIPGYKLVQKSGRRSWEKDQTPIMKSLLTMTAEGKRIFKKADIVEEKLISFTNILANVNLSDPQKKKIKKDFIKDPTGQKTLVLKTEKGKDISPAALLENMPEVEMQTGDKT